MLKNVILIFDNVYFKCTDAKTCVVVYCCSCLLKWILRCMWRYMHIMRASHLKRCCRCFMHIQFNCVFVLLDVFFFFVLLHTKKYGHKFDVSCTMCVSAQSLLLLLLLLYYGRILCMKTNQIPFLLGFYEYNWSLLFTK